MITELLNHIGDGHGASTPYNTAWIVRLWQHDEALARSGHEWLRTHQLPDGSWGASEPFYAHDRLTSTLAAVTALARCGHSEDRKLIADGCQSLEKLLAPTVLESDDAGSTVGFEMIVPTQVTEARELGLLEDLSHHAKTVLQRLQQFRDKKLAMLPNGTVDRNITAAYSSEMAGKDGLSILGIDDLQENNGSVACNPSATAFFALFIAPGDEKALTYLKNAANNDGGMPEVSPFDVFEIAWCLWNLDLTERLTTEQRAFCKTLLDRLEAAWIPGQGVGFASHYTPKDCDDTGMSISVLARFERPVSVEDLLLYENESHFSLFPWETKTSLSGNVHALEGLRASGLPPDHPSVQKIVRFLDRTRQPQGYWLDKLHTSPLYTASHAVIASAGYCEDVVRPTVRWIQRSQRPDGAWGHHAPTAEETAYALQALTMWARAGGDVALDSLDRGKAWLSEHAAPPYEPLWIGKCLYCPTLVVRSAVVSALLMEA